MQLNSAQINRFSKHFQSLLIVTAQDRQPYRLPFPTYLCVVCQLYLIDNPLEEHKAVGVEKRIYISHIIYITFHPKIMN